MEELRKQITIETNLGTITADAITLIHLSTALYDAAHDNAENGFTYLVDYYRESARKIHNTLKTIPGIFEELEP